jgi:hypothetical protein
MKLRIALILACILALPLPAYPANAEQEIGYLIQRVADSGCIYVRNGTEHDAADAADHLRLKYKRGNRYADTAENFIDRLATKSSWTGEPYILRCGDESEPAGAWLHRELATYRQEHR